MKILNHITCNLNSSQVKFNIEWSLIHNNFNFNSIEKKLDANWVEMKNFFIKKWNHSFNTQDSTFETLNCNLLVLQMFLATLWWVNDNRWKNKLKHSTNNNLLITIPTLQITLYIYIYIYIYIYRLKNPITI
jgi:hypothetical protein